MIASPLMRTLIVLRWLAGCVVFVGAALVFGQMASESRSAPVPTRLAARLTPAEAPRYSSIPAADPVAQKALQFALSDQRRKNRVAVNLLSVLSAERQSAAGTNVRLCLSINRQGRADSARVVVHRTDSDKWSVTLWAWGACGRSVATVSSQSAGVDKRQ
jgi:hypothetical protein